MPVWSKKKKHKSRKCRVPNKTDPKKPTARHLIIKIAKIKDKERIQRLQDGGKIGGSKVHSPLTWVKYLADLLRNKANSQQYPSTYEDRRPKCIEDTEKADGKGIASGR